MQGQQLYVDGFELRSAWQVKPGVARFQGRTVLVIVDDADELHAYYSTAGAVHMRDAGKLRLTRTGKAIGVSALGGGASGTVSLEIVDFDLDGTLDLLVGAPRHGSVPDAATGLPRAQGFPGAVALLLRGRVEEQGRLPRFAHATSWAAALLPLLRYTTWR